MKNGLAIYAGGNHIFYNLGVLKYLSEMGLQFDVIATYSAGASILPLIVQQNFDQGLKIFSSYLDNNTHNVLWHNIARSGDMFPHDNIYSSAINSLLDYQAINTYYKPLRVIVAEYPGNILPDPFVGLCAFFFLFLYGLTAQYTKSLFLKAFHKIFSITGVIIDIRNCPSRDEVINVILGSSTVYPFIKIRTRQGRAMLDGKLSLLTPIGILDDCDNVLSIHAHYTFPTPRKSLFQIFPLTKVNAGPLNYVGSQEIKTAFAQGYTEGATHYDRLKHTPFFAH